MANPDALRAAFGAATSWNEWATALVVGGLIVEFLALLFFSKDMSRKEKALLAIGSVMVAVGVGGEYVFGGRAASAAKALQQASDEKIAGLERDQEGDHRIATQAASDAARLGVSVGTLHNFVTGKQQEIDRQFSQFRTFAEGERKRAESVISDLNADKARLDKARSDAAASVTEAQRLVGDAKATILEQRVALTNVRAQLSDLSSRVIVTEAATAPRVIGEKETATLLTALKPFKGQSYVGMIVDGGRDEHPLWKSLDAIFRSAGWKRGTVEFPFGDPPAAIGIDVPPGVTVEMQKGGDNATADAAVALVEALNVGPRLSARLSETPQFNHLKPGEIGIVIGPIPP
jgi:hypothetical protein